MRTRGLFRSLLFAGALLSIVSSRESAAKDAQRSVRVDGIHLRAYLVAFSEHIKMPGLTERQKQIDGYTIEFSEDQTHIYVELISKLPPGWRTFGGDTPNGRAALYTVDKTRQTILCRQMQ